MSVKTVVFFWENFGPMHNDRCEAVAEHLSHSVDVVGVELSSRSNTYEWESDRVGAFSKEVIYSGAAPRVGLISRVIALMKVFRKYKRATFFLCHYSLTEVFACAILLRILGCRVLTMSCSKYDDQPRSVAKEFLKALYLTPYQGAISSGTRPADYLRFLGLKKDSIIGEYNTLSIKRIRQMAGVDPAPGGAKFGERHFIVVARLVPKKNLFMLLRAYAIYREKTANPRNLDICGSGPLESELINLIETLGLTRYVNMRGFLQTDQISVLLGTSLALILPSVEEQFGNVVIESQAMGLPVLLSDRCGARDALVRSGVNGFVFEPDNERGLAYFMGLLSESEALWREMCEEALKSAELGDVGRFAEAVEFLLQK